VTSDDQIERWIVEFETEGEQAVRDSINFKGGLVTGGEPKLATARRWLRDLELKRETEAKERKRYERVTLKYLKWTFWAAAISAVLTVIGIAVTILVTTLH
jgi:hypothetical protein